MTLGRERASTSKHEPAPPTRASTSNAHLRGPKWIQYLQKDYNASFFKVTNLAERGSTIERHAYAPRPQGLAPPSTTNTLKEMINILRGSKTNKRRPFTDWRPDTTLFVLWFGVNEVYDALEKDKKLPLEAILATYGSSFDRLYALGARHFLIMNTPPVDIIIGPDTFPMKSPKDYVKDLNDGIAGMHKRLLHRHADANFFLFDVNSLWSRVISTPPQFATYADFKNLTNWCTNYAWNSEKLADFQPECGVGREQYFWLDNKHPTHAVQNLTAAMMVEDCFNNPGFRGYCKSNLLPV